jgi:hypothetical protein
MPPSQLFISGMPELEAEELVEPPPLDVDEVVAPADPELVVEDAPVPAPPPLPVMSLPASKPSTCWQQTTDAPETARTGNTVSHLRR